MKSVLSIQSHVVHGFVGNKAAIFPLQTQGWDVDNINTVDYSNHTGYGSFSGSTLSPDELKSIFQQLINLDIHYDAIITGYIPNSQLIRIINDFIREYKLSHPHLIYLLDPVMGDNHYLYVDKSCVSEYQEILNNKIVDIITPNQFELELLTNIKIESKFNLVKAINYLHDHYNISNVVITSVVDVFEDDLIHCIASVKNQEKKIEFRIPTIKSYFTGVGDLFSALTLDKYYKIQNKDGTERLSIAINQVLTIMEKTLKLTSSMSNKDLVGKINDANMKYFELKIIESRKFYDINESNFIEYNID
ncbi:unnamed protein product [Candida verbasci]|uniref:pyridoxal kinase n=1 Tax=Candida verbasci TaxID=1227364 RepID=A0A9W4TWW3_9ASCO|nr:unnamed protein product [Candida verbasci]